MFVLLITTAGCGKNNDALVTYGTFAATNRSLAVLANIAAVRWPDLGRQNRTFVHQEC